MPFMGMNELCRRVLTVSACVDALLTGFTARASAEPSCPASPRSAFVLSHLQTALAGSPQAIIVALGSSSSEGVAASDPAHGYPAELQTMLNAGLPRAHVAVLNRGIGGQDAPEEFARLDADVLAVRPQLVIWQVGANGAMRNADPAEFKRLVTEGVQRMQARGVDVILMDNQRSPRIQASTEHGAMETALAEVARETGVSLFSRSALMDHWNREGAPYAQFVAADGLHHNDRGYFCVARSLADNILIGLRQNRPVTASR